MRARKHLTGGQRLANLGYGIVGILIAIMIAKHGGSEWSGVAAFIIGAFAVGGIFRGLFGFDEV